MCSSRYYVVWNFLVLCEACSNYLIMAARRRLGEVEEERER